MGENPKILATQSTKNKTETNSSKKQTPTTGMYTDTLKGYEVTRHETNIDKPCRTPLYEIIQEQQQSGSIELEQSLVDLEDQNIM
jgi:hypothetical protein